LAITRVVITDMIITDSAIADTDIPGVVINGHHRYGQILVKYAGITGVVVVCVLVGAHEVVGDALALLMTDCPGLPPTGAGSAGRAGEDQGCLESAMS
jgi:hypothetical protein